MLKNEQEIGIFVPKDNGDVYALPVGLLDQADENFPSFRACGLDWDFVLLKEDGSWTRAGHDVLKDRHMSIGEMETAVKDNIDSCLKDIAITTLIGKASDITTMPFVKVHFTAADKCPPFGVSLMLSNEAVSMVHQCIGDFYAFPADISAFYAVSAQTIEKYGLDPMKSFTNMIRSHGEEHAVFFKNQTVFYGTDAATSGYVKRHPMAAWKNV